MPTFVDTHCHLDHHFDLSASEQVDNARAESVGMLVTVGTSMASSTQAVQTASRHDGVYAAVGIHPNDAMEASDRVLGVIDKLARQDSVVGIGETGLDYYRDHTTPAQQESAYRAHIELAHKHDKTLVIHCREAWDDCLDILEDEGAPDRVVMHCFSGDLDVTRHCAEQGYFMSFAGNVTFHNAEPLREVAAEVPDDLLLTETDSPYLTPEPHRGKTNEPARVPHVVSGLAGVRGTDVEPLAEILWTNAHRAFALEEPTNGHPQV
ncbi:MAG: TatD family hydrolase [Nitriliruptorales bacterium]|nr:TatD family hydrolase [Nitriliruptorales bacterium]